MRSFCRAVVYRHPIIVGALAFGLFGAGLGVVLNTPSGAQGSSPGALVRVVPPSSTFDEPWSVCSNGTDAWVANTLGNSLTELDASTGAVVQVLSGGTYGLNFPSAVSCDGTHVWVNNVGTGVTSPTSSFLSELDASTGSVVQVIQGASYGFDDPIDISSDGTHVWVTNQQGNSVTEVDAATGALVQVINASNDGIYLPTYLSSDGAHVWVSNHNNTVTELDAATGDLVQVLSGSSYGFNGTYAIASDGTHVWIANLTGNSVTELDAATGALVRVVSGPSYGFSDPEAISSDGTDVWVANYNNSVTEFAAVTGATRPRRVRPELRIQLSLLHLVGRHPRLGGQLLRQLGHRAQCLHRRARSGDQLVDLRDRLSL